MAGLNRREQLSEIEAGIKEAEGSQYSTIQQAKEAKDYYDQVFGAYARAQKAAEQGMSPDEMAAARQGYAETSNLARQNALAASGGTLGKYINATLNANQGQFATQLAAQNAQIKRQNQAIAADYLNQLGSASQQAQAIETEKYMQNQRIQEQLGLAKQQWYDQKTQRQNELLKAAVGLGGSLGSAAILASDIRLKQGIVFSHEEKGHKVYEFSYKSEPNVRYSGVMAQEVLNINPSAVVEENGYYKVNYDMLGITMKKLN
jgi:hypothetical protein